MFKLPSQFKKKIAQPPGTLQILSKEESHIDNFTLYQYNSTNLDSYQNIDIKDPKQWTVSDKNNWFIQEGLKNIERIETIGKKFSFHSLLLEDILNGYHRPKIDEFNDIIFIILKTIQFDSKLKRIDFRQVSLVLGDNYLFSFFERESETKKHLLKRIDRPTSRLKRMGHDYLLYAIIDVIVDHYFIALEQIGEEIDRLEDQLMKEPGKDIQTEIHDLKRELSHFKRNVIPLRMIVESLIKSEASQINDESRIFYKDLFDHILYVLEVIDMYKEGIVGLRDLFMSQVNNKMNDVMKVLTIISTLFIPLTFIAGIYGMNFEWMPELKYKYGYFIILGIMGFTTILMLFFLKRKRWLKK